MLRSSVLLAWLPRVLKKRFIPLELYKQEVTAQVLSLIDQAQPNMETPTCLVEGMMSTDKSLSKAEILDEAIEALLGAGEAIGHTLVSALYRIMHDPLVQKNLRSELATNNFRIDVPVQTDQMSRYPYLAAVLRESMRLQRGNLYRFVRVIRYDIEHRGYVLPAGTCVSFAPLFVHSDPSVFPNPAAYHPERFTESEGQERARYIKCFGIDARRCAGESFAKFVLHNSIARLITEFDFSPSMTEEEIRQDGLLEMFPQNCSKGLTVIVERLAEDVCL